MVSTIRKWGNSLGLLVPKQLADAMKMTDGTEVELLQTEDGILIRPKDNASTLLASIIEGVPEDYEPEENSFDSLYPSEEW